MSDTERWVFGILIVALFGLVGVIYRNIIARLNRLDTGALGQFVAKDGERERAWWEWRTALDSDRRDRHAELTKRLDAHAEHFKAFEEKQQKLSERVTRLERNGH